MKKEQLQRQAADAAELDRAQEEEKLRNEIGLRRKNLGLVRNFVTDLRSKPASRTEASRTARRRGAMFAILAAVGAVPGTRLISSWLQSLDVQWTPVAEACAYGLAVLVLGAAFTVATYRRGVSRAEHDQRDLVARNEREIVSQERELAALEARLREQYPSQGAYR